MIVAITDRRVMDAPDPDAFAAAIARAIAGVPDVIVQVREKDLDGGALLAFVRAAMRVAPRVIVNDRVDVALAAGAAGVHLPERGMSIADARALLPAGAIVGVSRHAPGDADGADYTQLGPIFATPGKGLPLGTGVLASGTRLVAVGGIADAARARAARAAGAIGVAAIRAAWDGSLALLLG